MGSHAGYLTGSFVFQLDAAQSKEIAASGIEVKLKGTGSECLAVELDTNDIPLSIPRFKEEMHVDITFSTVSRLSEETHYKARHETEEFHPSCWYKSRVNLSIHSRPRKYLSTFYLVPKDERCTSEVEFWMTGKQRRQSSKEDYFHRKVTEEERPILEQLGVI